MSDANNPADLQQMILDRLLKKEPEQPAEVPKVTNEKFSKGFGEVFDVHLKDNNYHEIEVDLSEADDTSFGDYISGTNDAHPLAVIYDQQRKPMALVKCDADLIMLLARIYLGGDIESVVKSTRETFTETELGMVQIFAESVGFAVKAKTGRMPGDTTTQLPAEIEPHIYEGLLGSRSTYKFDLKENHCTFDVVFIDNIVAGREDDEHEDDPFDLKPTSEEISRSPLTASVHLEALPMLLSDVQKLRVGDCLRFDNSNGLVGSLLVNDQELFVGEIGKSAGRYSFRISAASQKNASTEARAVGF